jgi:hypothetical protein
VLPIWGPRFKFVRGQVGERSLDQAQLRRTKMAVDAAPATCGKGCSHSGQRYELKRPTCAATGRPLSASMRPRLAYHPERPFRRLPLAIQPVEHPRIVAARLHWANWNSLNFFVGHVPPCRGHAAMSQHLALDHAGRPQVLSNRNLDVPVERWLRLGPIQQVGERYGTE